MSILLLGACKESPRVLDFPLDQLREGDLAFRCGRGVFSRAVTLAEQDGIYSHVGLLVREEGEWKVIHAVPGEPDFPGDPERVKDEPLEVFFDPSRAIRGCLVHTGEGSDAQRALLARRALGFARDSVRFDDNYDLEDSSRVYCTEFVWRMYKGIGVDLSEGRRRYVNVVGVHGDCLLPEHLLEYKNNTLYYHF